jgi:hypothetical protein
MHVPVLPNRPMLPRRGACFNVAATELRSLSPNSGLPELGI